MQRYRACLLAGGNRSTGLHRFAGIADVNSCEVIGQMKKATATVAFCIFRSLAESVLIFIVANSPNIPWHILFGISRIGNYHLGGSAVVVEAHVEAHCFDALRGDSTACFQKKGTCDFCRLVGRFRNVRVCLWAAQDQGAAQIPGMGTGNVETCFLRDSLAHFSQGDFDL